MLRCDTRIYQHLFVFFLKYSAWCNKLLHSAIRPNLPHSMVLKHYQGVSASSILCAKSETAQIYVRLWGRRSAELTLKTSPKHRGRALPARPLGASTMRTHTCAAHADIGAHACAQWCRAGDGLCSDLPFQCPVQCCWGGEQIQDLYTYQRRNSPRGANCET